LGWETKAVGLADGEAAGGSSGIGVALDFASIASTSPRAVPYLFLETVVTSCRRAMAWPTSKFLKSFASISRQSLMFYTVE
jgi:hypothetical protein